MVTKVVKELKMSWCARGWHGQCRTKIRVRAGATAYVVRCQCWCHEADRLLAEREARIAPELTKTF